MLVTGKGRIVAGDTPSEVFETPSVHASAEVNQRSKSLGILFPKAEGYKYRKNT